MTGEVNLFRHPVGGVPVRGIRPCCILTLEAEIKALMQVSSNKGKLQWKNHSLCSYEGKNCV